MGFVADPGEIGSGQSLTYLLNSIGGIRAECVDQIEN
jgi:hypothetical protein